MIRSLRSRHRWLITFLTVGTVALFALSISARRPQAVEKDLPAVLEARLTDRGIAVRFSPESPESAPTRKLAYWLPLHSEERGDRGLRGALPDGVPGGATLLGVLDDRGQGLFPTPGEARLGRVVLYDLVTAEVHASETLRRPRS